MILELGHVYYRKDLKELFKIIEINSKARYPMKCINHLDEKYNWKEDINGYMISHLGEGELSDYPEYMF